MTTALSSPRARPAPRPRGRSPRWRTICARPSVNTWSRCWLPRVGTAAAADRLGISRRTFYRRLHKHNLLNLTARFAQRAAANYPGPGRVSVSELAQRQQTASRVPICPSPSGNSDLLPSDPHVPAMFAGESNAGGFPRGLVTCSRCDRFGDSKIWTGVPAHIVM